jgi:hypothetical protein
VRADKGKGKEASSDDESDDIGSPINEKSSNDDVRY